MSFSSSVKEELSKLNNLSNKEQVETELIGYLISNNTSIVKSKIKFATESEYNINRFSKLLNNMNIVNYQIEMQGKSFIITFNKDKINNYVKIEDNKIYVLEIKDDEEYIRGLIRGVFLGSGSMSNPENKYHLEIALSTKQSSNLVYLLLEKFEINMKILDGNNLYIKEGEEISRFLAFIGANSSVLKFEEIRVVRHMNNKVNRLVNCETANMNKTMNAAVEQIEAIEYLKKQKAYESLEDSLKEIAEVRMEHPDVPLSELGKYLKNPIGKSGVNYRLKKIIEIAEELKK